MIDMLTTASAGWQRAVEGWEWTKDLIHSKGSPTG